MADEIYYLSSLDSTRFEPVRECRFDRTVMFDSGKVAVVARLSPGVIGQDFHRPSDIDTVILSPRHEGSSLDPVSEFPCFVFIAIPTAGYDRLQRPIRSDELEIIGWGELHRTHADAERHTFPRTYDERALIGRLARLDRRSKTAFAAACAQRLAPLFDRYARSIGEPQPAERLGQVINAAWDSASGVDRGVRADQADAEAMVPSDDDGWTLESGYAQNAAGAAAYAIRTWRTDDAQEAAWAGRQVYELADFAVLQRNPELDLNSPEATTFLIASDLVQWALAALDRTLDEIESRPATWQQLRAAAEADGRWLADAVPTTERVIMDPEDRRTS